MKKKLYEVSVTTRRANGSHRQTWKIEATSTVEALTAALAKAYATNQIVKARKS